MEQIAIVILGMSGLVGWFDILVCHGKIGVYIAARVFDPMKVAIMATLRGV